MTYAVIDPASVGRAARDMTRLSKEIVELTIEAANGLAAPRGRCPHRAGRLAVQGPCRPFGSLCEGCPEAGRGESQGHRRKESSGRR